MRNGLAAAFLVGLVATSAMGAEEWQTVTTGAVSIRVRMRPDIPGGREVWAEGFMDAGLPFVRAALRDHALFRKWMPYVNESRILSEESPNVRVTYTQLDFPIISNRDYVLRVEEEEGQAEDGSVTFTQKWTPNTDAVPERQGVVRLHHNSGSWLFTPQGEARVRYVYRFTAEPGGAIPGFLAGVGQKDAVLDTVHAVERRARELAARAVPSP
ncbi:MAG: START domain-containing protein [Cystobacter sp.]